MSDNIIQLNEDLIKKFTIGGIEPCPITLYNSMKI